MSSRIQPCNLPIIHHKLLPQNYSSRLFSLISLTRSMDSRSLSSISASSSSSSAGLNQQEPLVSHGSQYSSSSSLSYKVKFETLEECKLGISGYPDFTYNAKGGLGLGSAIAAAAENDDDEEKERISVSFDVGALYIPPLTSSTTKFLGLPLPPFLKIDIVPELFQGTIGRGSGKVELEFRAKFMFSAGKVYRAPPLTVATTLTTEESVGGKRRGKGKRLIDGDGRCTLVGVAVVDPIDDVLMNSFLGLPTECIAVLNAHISSLSPTSISISISD